MDNNGIYIGLMSGTSLDAVDVAAVRFEPHFEFLGAQAITLPDALREDILALCSPAPNEIDRAGQLDQTLGQLFAACALQLIDSLGLAKETITAIGSHGQTIRHRPEQGFTLQIGNPALIAEKTGITTAADFRPRDIAAGGQGAPLVPAFHRALFRHPNKSRVILNVGGMANITWLPANPEAEVLGFDTGPGNVLLDDWIQQQRNKPYDKNGDWGASGDVQDTLLTRMLALPYFSEPAPKSTGREQFNRQWLKEQLDGLTLKAEDVQSTLCELTARTVADQILQLPKVDEIFICGGGSHNQHLCQRIKNLTQLPLSSTEALGLSPDWVEACAFGWLAHQTLNRLPGNLPAVTGAEGPRILGAIYPA